MVPDQAVETCHRYCGHNYEQAKTAEQRIEFTLQPGILVTKDQYDDEHSTEAEHDGEARPHYYQGDSSQRTHERVPFWYKDRPENREYDEYALDPRTRAI